MSRDKITIALFSTEKDGGDFNPGLFNEKDNIEKIKKEFSSAALAMGRDPPEIVISVLLVPNWKREGNSYDDPQYLSVKQKFLARTRDIFSIGDVVIQDLYIEAGLTDAEKTFMHCLEALGSNLDILKFRAVINNQNCLHLQLDSNTKIHNYGEFYRQTFGLPKSQQKDALNAAYYDNHYISAHSKVIYTVPKGVIGRALEARYLQYCEEHQHDLNAKNPKINSVYGQAFVVAMDDVGLTKLSKDPTDGWVFHPANLERAEYRITSIVVTAVLKSWSGHALSSEELAIKRALEGIDSVQVGDASCDLECFKYLIKKYTGNIWQHALDIDEDPSLPLNAPQRGTRPREQLLALSNQEIDMTILITYYNHVVLNNFNCAIHLARIIPDTLEGNQLTSQLFNCTVLELYDNPGQMATFNANRMASADSASEAPLRLESALVKYSSFKSSSSVLDVETTSNRSAPLKPK